MSHVGLKPDAVVDERHDRDLAHEPRAFEHLDLNRSPGETSRISAEHRREHEAVGRERQHAAAPVDDAVEARRLGSPVIASVRDRWPARRRTGTLRIGSTSMTPGRCATEDMARADRGSTKRHHRILPHAHDELLVDQHVHDVDERQADEQHGDGEGDADDGHRRPDG